MRQVLVISEHRYGYDPEFDMEDCLLSIDTYEVDLQLLEDFKVNYEHEYNYISTIIEAALADAGGADKLKPSYLSGASRKYSFGDMPEWYASLKPPVGEPADRRYFYYEVH